MRRRRFERGQIERWLSEHARGMPVAELCRAGGFADTTFYRWKARHAELPAPARVGREDEKESASMV